MSTYYALTQSEKKTTFSHFTTSNFISLFILNIIILLYTTNACSAPVNTEDKSFIDNFNTNTTGNYTIKNTWTKGGVGSFIYDSTGKRAQVLTGDDVALSFSRNLPVLDKGTFSLDFLPITKYPAGGIIDVYLRQDANNYYWLQNTDGYGAKSLKKVIGGAVVASASFSNQYSQNTNYTITIDFSPGLTTVNAFGQVLTINTNSSSIMVGSFEVESTQQRAYYDNISYKNFNNAPTTLRISQPDGVGDTVTAGSSYNVTYSLGDTDDVVTAAFFYDTNNTGLDGTAITGACAAAPEGTGVTCSWNTTGITPGTYYVYGRTNDGTNPVVSAYSPGVITINASSCTTLFSDNFDTNSTGSYTLTNTWTKGGVGSFVYDSTGKRAQVIVGDDVALKFSRSLPVLGTGTFSIDFRPTVKYPNGGIIDVYLRQDANTYYRLNNSDGYGAGYLKKFVGGAVVDSAVFSSQYSQNTNYTITINFSPGLTTVNAFGQVLTINTNSSSIMVGSFEVESTQQRAYYDTISYAN
ncbi:MAG: hypothetical protein MRK02_05700 [Candidatus Scalindua sp.]|nr:hypothetical protein [Candidatus Scalindua sp.]